MTLLHRLIFTLLIITSAASITHAASMNGRFGVGIILGGPTGLSGKYFLDREQAIDVGLAFDIDDFVLIYGDYLKHFPGAFGAREKFFTELTPYIGVGPVIVLDSDDRKRNDRYFADDDDDFGVGVRIPLGIEWMSQNPKIPIGIALEIVPGMIIIPGTDLFFQGGVAFRYYF